MKKYPKKWTHIDFDAMSWHDNRVHGIRINNPPEGYDFDLILEINYILEWIKVEDSFRFVVAPATLTFHGVDKARLDLTLIYKQNLNIDRVERQEIAKEAAKKTGVQKWLFQVHFYDQANPISVASTGFTQELTTVPALTEHQALKR